MSLINYTYDFPVGTEQVDPDGKEELVHYPPPSDDPSDPLNWSRTWKTLSFIAVQNYVVWITIAVSALASIYAPLMLEFSATENQIAAFTSWMALLLGLGNFFWIPYSMAWGRRPAVFFSNLLSIAMSFWFAAAGSYRSAFLARTLIGLTGAPLEIIGPYQIADVFFTQERGLYHGISFCIICTATSMASPIAAAFEQNGIGWRAFFYWISAMIAFSQVVIFFICPETKWRREAVGSLEVSDITQQQTVGVDPSDEKMESAAEVTATIVEVEAANRAAHGLSISLVGKGAPTSAQRYGLFPVKDPEYNIIKETFMVLRVLRFPATWLVSVWWMAYGGSSAAGGYVAAYVWSAAPYNFTVGQVGLTAIPSVIGSLLGFLVVGPLSDWDLKRRTRNNGGIREPEMRLWLIIPGGILSMIGIVLYGCGVEYGWHWAIPLVLGNGINGFGVTAPIVCSCSYAIDTYKQYAGEISFNMTLWKDIFTFAAGYYMSDLIIARGRLTATLLPSIPVFFAFFFTIAFLIWGKAWRRWTSSSSLLRGSR